MNTIMSYIQDNICVPKLSQFTFYKQITSRRKILMSFLSVSNEC